MTAHSHTVAIVDDDEAVRTALARLLALHGFEIRTFDSPDTFLAAVPPFAPHCAVLDLKMPAIGGLELQAEMARRRLAIPVIFLTGHGDVPASVRAMKQGATDFLEKPVRPDALLQAIRGAIALDTTRRLARLRTEHARSRLAVLSAREKEIFELIVKGKLSKEVGWELGITERTVKFHRGRIAEKLGGASVADLVRLAEQATADEETN
jgi:FixJ family two-component response regulator